MSKGSRIVTLRLPDDMMSSVYEALKRRNERTRDSQWSLSDWIRAAAEDKLKHVARGRRGSRKRKYLCNKCGERHGVEHVSHTIKPIFGPREYQCVFCQSVTLGD